MSMRYSEEPVPAKLKPFVSVIWRMEAGGSHGETLEQKAVPDGCIELIFRPRGRSGWDTPQPPRFVAGLCSKPAMLTMSGDASFIGVRLWPWAWNLLGDLPCPQLHDRWIPVAAGSPGHRLLADGEHIPERVAQFFDTLPAPDIGCHISSCHSPGALVERSGRSPRYIQRWFKREIGLSARQYFRLLRFQNAVNGAALSARQTERAADAGYADQAHMNRDFRHFSGETPAGQRRSSVGPFLSSPEA